MIIIQIFIPIANQIMNSLEDTSPLITQRNCTEEKVYQSDHRHTIWKSDLEYQPLNNPATLGKII